MYKKMIASVALFALGYGAGVLRHESRSRAVLDHEVRVRWEGEYDQVHEDRNALIRQLDSVAHNGADVYVVRKYLTTINTAQKILERHDMKAVYSSGREH